MKKRDRFHIVCIMLCALVLFAVCPLQSQILRKPVPQFTAPCASDGFNNYKVGFEWLPPLVGSTNTFILELSNGEGDFSDPITLGTYTDKNTTLRFEFEFTFPDYIRGDNFRVRVRSTSPARTSPPSDSFPAYFVKVRQSLQLGNEDGDMMFGQFRVCTGETMTLKVINYPNEPAYRWYRNGNIVPIPGETGPTLEVHGIGYYYAEVDYGDFCSSGTSSNIVEIIIDDIADVEIEGPGEVIVCPGDNYVLEADADDSDYIYRWYKNGIVINTPGYQPTLNVSNTEPAGIYRVEIENANGCINSSDPIRISVPNMNLAIAGPDNRLLLPGDTIELTVNTTAPDPAYQWYRDNTILSGETSPTLSVNTPGEYHVTVTPGSGTCTATMTSNTVNVALPLSLNVFVETNDSYADCAVTQTSISVSSIQVETTDGAIIEVRPELINRLNYQWLKDGQPLAGETNSIINITEASMNGDYSLRAAINTFDRNSNAITIQLQPDITPLLTSDGSISCSGASNITISSDITDAGYQYAWYLNNELIANENTPTLTTNLTGSYILVVTAFGCPVNSNEIIITPFEESALTVDTPENIVIVEGFAKTITASGADTYQWFNEDNIEISNSNIAVLTEEGQYILRAFIGECEIIKIFNLTFQDNSVVPNVISPNSDGINDLWILPNRYALQQDVEVYIYGPNGETVFRTRGYQNNWPESNLSYPANKPVFYYKIVRGREILKQGTITLIR